jgi:hypothetical protein
VSEALVVNFKSPQEYESLLQIRVARRHLRRLSNALKTRETEVIEERSLVELSEEMIAQAISLHDSRCGRHHKDKPNSDLPNECGLHLRENWNLVLQSSDTHQATALDQQWHWIMEASKASVASKV